MFVSGESRILQGEQQRLNGLLNTLGWNIQKLKIVSTVQRVDSLTHMLIVFDSKSSLTHYIFDKIKFQSQLHICIILLYLIFYFSKFMFKSWLVSHENWVSVGSFLVPGNCKNAGCCTIYPRPLAVRQPLQGGGRSLRDNTQIKCMQYKLKEHVSQHYV
jgi:hypothetical protein